MSSVQSRERTVSGLASEYIRSKKKLGEFTPNSARGVRYTLGSFSDAVGPDKPIRSVKRFHVERWLENLKVAPATRRARFSQLRTFLQWCFDHDHAPTNPARGIKAPKVPLSMPRGLSAEQISAVLREAPDSRLRLVCILMCQEGLRAAEVAGLMRENIDLQNRTLVVMGKGSKERIMPITAETFELLCDYWADAPSTSGPLIRSQRSQGRGISSAHISEMVSTLMRDAGVKISPRDGRSGHALRHSCADHMFERGADVREVSEYLGHASLQSTQIYLRRLRAVGPLRDAGSGRTYMATSSKAEATTR